MGILCKSLNSHCSSPEDLSVCGQQRPHRRVMPFAPPPPPPYTGVQAVDRWGELEGVAAALALNDMPAQKKTPAQRAPLLLS